MRVIAGKWGGRPLAAPPGTATRPTADRVKEALFSMLGDLEGVRVLDLFAGSGALGIEALSRGAEAATFVDSAGAAISAVRENLERLGADATVVRKPALAYLDAANHLQSQYDLVFLDPPYATAGELGSRLSAALTPILASEARIVSESDRRHPLELEAPLVQERRYGDTLIRIHDA
ncbi:MAG: 16S rRNA (guanine(966)-N(2))-methyltransferase RsmD [Solirubrobacterales bacterium]|nr:16S rRNA (guanine(966)-N(2))-methyltransferase RsmD [Solirubrobacterales bacterium]